MSELRTSAPGPTRRGRRPLPAVIFFLVLAVAATLVWWNVARQQNELDAAQAATCSTASAAPQSFDPGDVELRVYNAGAAAGKASEVATTLKSRGFTVSDIGNTTDIDGVGELRFGARGQEIANYMSLYLKSADQLQDTRADETVDLVLGPDFKALASKDAVDSSLSAAASASAAC